MFEYYTDRLLKEVKVLPSARDAKGYEVYRFTYNEFGLMIESNYWKSNKIEEEKNMPIQRKTTYTYRFMLEWI